MAVGYSYAQVSQKKFETIIIGNADVIQLNIKGADIHLKETKGRRLLVETKVVLSVPNQALLNFVVENGRYDLNQVMDEATRTFELSSKENRNIIVVKGEECQEHISYTIYVPSNLKVNKL